MKFEVPFDSNENYLNLINNPKVIHSVYYGLSKGVVPSARTPFSFSSLDDYLIKSLGRLDKNIKKYLTCNGVFLEPNLYLNNDYLSETENLFNSLFENNALNGIIVFDIYFLKAIKDFDLIKNKRIKIIPSINFKIDSISRLNSIIFQIESILGFQYIPEEIIIDRSLNRDKNKLSEISNYIRETHPLSTIILLANEGCINHCSFKHTHDGIISLVNMGYELYGKDSLSKFGCYDYFLKNPEQILITPFIRPEDLGFYKKYCDVIKISGRQLSSEKKTLILNSYINSKFNGNLLEILEAQSLNHFNIYIDNNKFKKSFIDIVTNCKKDCFSCNYCKMIFSEVGDKF